jgi:hypothetical protein
MKSRPRSVENQVASHISMLSEGIGGSQVIRLPVTGRTGPDITPNELGLIVDVKSRLQCPKGYFHKGFVRYGDLVGIPLDNMLDLLNNEKPEICTATSVIVERWYAHMDEWTQKKFSQGISCIVLHRPKMPIGKSMLVIHFNDIERFRTKCQTLQMLQQLSPPFNPAPTLLYPVPL